MLRYLIISCFALLIAMPAHALPVGNPRIPDSGLWWVPGQNGRFLHLDVGPDGYVFATVSGFVGNTASYLVMQGPLELAPIDESSATPVIGSLSSPLYSVANGACFGCEWRAPDVQPSNFGSGTLTFLASDELRLQAFGRTTTFRRFPLYSTAAGAPSERLLGQWLVVLRTDQGLVRDLVEIASDEGDLTFRFPTRPGPDTPAPSEASLAPCGTNRLAIAANGSLVGSSTVGRGCNGGTYVFHERDGALYGQRQASNFAERIASELLLYRVPPRWLADATSQSLAPGNARVPDAGLWWSPNRNGLFVHLDVGPDGYVFATVSGFVNGVASYLVLQGPMQLEPLQAGNPAQLAASLTSPLYTVSGGTCFACSWRAPSVGESPYGSATLRYFGGFLELDAFGTTTQFRRFPLFTTAAASAPDRYVGRWLVLLRTGTGVLRDFVRFERFEDRLLVLPLDATAPSAASLSPCNAGWFSGSAGGGLSGLSSGGFRCVVPTYGLNERDGALYGQRNSLATGPSQSMASEVLLYRVPDDW